MPNFITKFAKEADNDDSQSLPVLELRNQLTTIWFLQYQRNRQADALAIQGQFAEAEALLVESAERLLSDPSLPSPHIAGVDIAAETASGVVNLHKAWDNVEQGKGYDDKAKHWEQKLKDHKAKHSTKN